MFFKMNLTFTNTGLLFFKTKLTSTEASLTCFKAKLISTEAVLMLTEMNLLCTEMNLLCTEMKLTAIMAHISPKNVVMTCFFTYLENCPIVPYEAYLTKMDLLLVYNYLE